jgi:uncharacterized protein involved in cysteine biosynthesis
VRGGWRAQGLKGVLFGKKAPENVRLVPAGLEEVALFTPIIRAFSQLDDPAIIKVVLQTLLFSLLSFAGLVAGSTLMLHHLLVGHGWLAWLGGSFGGLIVLISALWLFLPLAVVIAGLFLEPVCRAVERAWYPDLPPAVGASLVSQTWDGLIIGLRVLLLTIVSLLLALLFPGVGNVVGWLITAWAVGRGMYSAVALRRMDRVAAEAQYRDQRLVVLAQGAALTLAGAVPLLNLLVPVLGPAAMVHVVIAGRSRLPPSGAARF